ncbi:Dyp-type peroxidase [Alishewanella tabrizica]|uniref:Peroxidase n=1 Tax=Alishewanella tabrizica TaxID=671278 RepID=A0ABQ2WK14_9ALTE|nr:Dyp-type peroxidase [Alishewanella tabrizica]GGW55721.1 peroxidase [Alishewanella tabrizica]
MAREQLGICAEANLHGSYLLCNALDGQEAMLRQKLARIPQMLQRLSEHFSEAMLTGIVAVSSHYWDHLYPWHRPDGLQAFPESQSEYFSVQHSTVDLLIQVRSDRLDVIHIVLQQIYQLIIPNVEVVEHLSSFRYLDGRQLTGFLDVPFNPRGLRRRQVALVEDARSTRFAGSSYLHFHRLVLDQKHWLQLNTTQQEEIMGYRKIDGKAIAGDTIDESSHYACCLATQGGEYSLLQQNMPFATLKQQGSLQLSFSADSQAFTKQWQHRLGLTQPRIYDSLLDFCRIDLAAAFFVPSLSYIEAAARGEFASTTSDLLK